MLVLSRRSGEELVIPHYGIVLTILDVRGDRVRVGVTAPADVEVYRRELWERLEQCNLSVGKTGKPSGKV